MSAYGGFNAHEKPPEAFRRLFKAYQKTDISVTEKLGAIIDTKDISTGIYSHSLLPAGNFASEHLKAAFAQFLDRDSCTEVTKHDLTDIPVFESKTLPGLLLVPSLFPAIVQLQLLKCLFHRDLSNPAHKTNVHLHHHVIYPEKPSAPFTSQSSVSQKSFFSEATDRAFAAKDPVIHKDLTVKDFLSRKLRWVTLGGQYDWTKKTYPPGSPPDFPSDIAELLHSLFPSVEAQAAIVNLYSPGDTLSVHRDVSEQTIRGLVSISLGCEAIFVIGDGVESHAFRLRSGDAIFMAKHARFAWHGVPKILKNTCPTWMEAWPGEHKSGEFEAWRGWMANKRVNLNVRQVHEPKNDGSAELGRTPN